MNLIQRVQGNHQRVGVLRIPIEERNDRRVGLLVQPEVRLRNGEIAPDVVVLRLAIERLAQRLQRVGRLPEAKPSVRKNHLQRRQLQLRRAGALPRRHGFLVAPRRRIAGAEKERRDRRIGRIAKRDAELVRRGVQSPPS